MPTISRNEYVGLFGATTGDRIRLGDTGLFVEIERDLRGAYGDEIVFGGGKSLREGMGMDNKLTYAAGPPDLVITRRHPQRSHMRHRQVRQSADDERHHAGAGTGPRDRRHLG